VSEFIVRTCRLIPKSNNNVFDSLHLQVIVPSEHHEVVCGSSAEFLIRPIRSCIGDVDVFEIKTHALAFTDKKPELPYEVRHNADIIDCFLMEPYLNYPSFVRLRPLGQLRYKWGRKIFEFAQIDVKEVVITAKLYEIKRDRNDQGLVKAGPALKRSFTETGSFSTDQVVAIWCPQWPNEAKDWPRRQRKNNWPTTDKIHEVVQNGCHVVDAKHPACKSDIHQCRISFSIAELILLQSWTQVQQIVYHMLRFFAKRELIRKDCPKEDEVLCSYHLKTLMLWSCEEMSSEWWNSLSVIKICCNLLQKLSKWVKETRCPNYFIPQANLFHDRFNREIVNETINILTHYSYLDILSLWFLEHYLKPQFPVIFDFTRCVRKHTLRICTLMKEYKLQSIDSYLSALIVIVVRTTREATTMRSKMKCFDLFKYGLRVGHLYNSEYPPSAEIESCFWTYSSMLYILQSAHSLCFNELLYPFFVEIIREISIKPKSVICRHHNIPYRSGVAFIYDSESQFYFRKAEDLMENLTGSNGDGEFKVVSEIAKLSLIQVFQCEDSNRNNFERPTFAYLAALHFAASEYQVAAGLCSRVIMDEKLENEETETLNAGCLLYIDGIIEIIGFNRVFEKVTEAPLQRTEIHQIFLDLRLKPEVFAYYLIALSVERSACSFGLKNISQSPTFPLDAILIAIAYRKYSRKLKERYGLSRVYQRTNPSNKLKVGLHNELILLYKHNIIGLLVGFSLENMTSFYDIIGRDFGIHCSTVDCYRASCLYKCRQYPEAVHLCEDILNKPDLENDLKELTIANVMLVPPLDTFFDRDIQCSLGLHTLVCFLLSSTENLTEGKDSEASFQRIFTSMIKSSGSKPISLSRLLNESYFVKCHYFLGRHFLARYLKVRCLIDCNCSLLEIMFEFKNLKACLPFEHVIRCFLKKKLWQFKNVLDTV